jgi:hypothetical protein
VAWALPVRVCQRHRTPYRQWWPMISVPLTETRGTLASIIKLTGRQWPAKTPLMPCQQSDGCSECVVWRRSLILCRPPCQPLPRDQAIQVGDRVADGYDTTRDRGASTGQALGQLSPIAWRSATIFLPSMIRTGVPSRRVGRWCRKGESGGNSMAPASPGASGAGQQP